MKSEWTEWGIIAFMWLSAIGLTLYTRYRKKKIMEEYNRQRKDLAEIKARGRW